MNLDERWERWCERFGQADRDVRDLFHNRHVWVAITQMWMDNAEAIQLNNIVQAWYVRLYVSTQCTGIRRECDAGTTTSSLENCLRELIKYPQMMTRARFEANVEANPEILVRFKEVNKEKFDWFTDSPTSDIVSPAKVEADIQRLRDAADATRKYTNKILAHREFPPRAIKLSWADLDGALNVVGDVLKHYYTLWNAGVIKGNLTPELPLGWEQPYRAAWSTEDFVTPSARPLDDYVPPVSTD